MMPCLPPSNRDGKLPGLTSGEFSFVGVNGYNDVELRRKRGRT